MFCIMFITFYLISLLVSESTDALSNIAIGGALLTQTGCSSTKQVYGCIKQFVSISHIDILPTHIDKSIEMNNIRSLPYAVQIQINIWIN